MHLAFITSLLPTGQPDTGFEIASACVLRALQEAGCKVKLFGFLRKEEGQTPPPDTVVLNRMVIENSAASIGQKLRWLKASFDHGLPMIATKLVPYANQLQAELDRHGPFDGYVVNSAPVAAAFPELLKQKPSLLITHHVEHTSARFNAANGGLVTGALYRREARLLEEAEHKALSEARFILCLAEEDRQSFGIDINARSAVMPLLTTIPAKLPEIETTHDVGLIGTWTWQPNQVGLRWFVDEVVPRLPSDFSIAIAGRLPKALQAKDNRVRLLGRVSDASAFFSNSRTIALTSRTGTGIQLKTIETFQVGKPSVATRSSIRGMGTLPPNCLVADDAKSYAAALTKLVLDVRSERTQLADGTAFIAAQKKGMKEAIRCALLALKQ